jgi:hypothetical protein
MPVFSALGKKITLRRFLLYGTELRGFPSMGNLVFLEDRFGDGHRKCVKQLEGDA